LLKVYQKPLEEKNYKDFAIQTSGKEGEIGNNKVKVS